MKVEEDDSVPILAIAWMTILMVVLIFLTFFAVTACFAKVHLHREAARAFEESRAELVAIGLSTAEARQVLSPDLALLPFSLEDQERLLVDRVRTHHMNTLRSIRYRWALLLIVPPWMSLLAIACVLFGVWRSVRKLNLL